MESIALPNLQVSTLDAARLDEHIGNTPLLQLRQITARLAPRVSIFVKAEWFNPSGSVKDRPAINILRSALAAGELSSGRRLLDSTSGNMGISYATFGKIYGIPVTLALPANASPERIKILRALGAELIYSDPQDGPDGPVNIVRQLARQQPELYYYANQYDNPSNWQAHFATTAPEILQQTDGKLTHFVAGMGTSGTLTGVSRYLRVHNPNVQIIAVGPNAASHRLEGLKHFPSSIQPAIYDPSTPDRIIEISTDEAYTMVRRLAREESMFVGVSSGAAAAAALKVASELDQGLVVTVFPDAGFKYLSDDALWAEPDLK